MKSYDYWYRQKEEQDKLNFKVEVMEEVRFMVQSALDQIKNDILGAINREIDIQVNTIIDGKKVNQIDIGSLVMDEIIRQFNSKI